MADDDLFIDKERIQKMIAAGIYDEDMANKLKGIKNKDLKDNKMIRPVAERSEPLREQRPYLPLGRVDKHQGRGRAGRGVFRGVTPPRGRGGQQWERGRGRDSFHNKLGFNPMSSTAHKWQEIVPRDLEEDEEILFHKRPRSPSQGDGFRDGFRDGIRDGIQNKIQRNETERNLSIDYMNDRNAGNSCTDTDLRPKTDTDSRIGDTDLRPVSNTSNRKTAPNLRNINSAANDGDYRLGSGDRVGIRGAPNTPFDRKAQFDQEFFGSNQRSGSSNATKNILIDDLDDFINKASSKLNITPSEMNEMSSRGRGRGQSSQREGGFNRPYGNGRHASDDPLGLLQTGDPLGLRQSDEDYDQRPQEDSPDIIEVPKEDENPINILKETVEELAKSNLYCQYCDCYLSSLVEVNTHIGTNNHQKNMAKKVMEENNNSGLITQSKPKEAVPIRPTISRTIVERVPTGMAVVVQMIEQKQQITLKSLTEMDNYEITSDSEAALAKELAKLLTNELLNYKMNLMPDTVKEALKHQGIGLINSMISN